MDLPVDEFLEGLFKPESLEAPSDKEKPEPEDMQLPSWYDEEKCKKAIKFYWSNGFCLSTSMLMGLVAVFAVPSILRVLVASQRSSSHYTAYKRYVSTLLHTVSWFEHELKPGTVAWKSLYTVRSRHFKAGVASKMRGIGTVSQRDLALTQFGFMGFSVLKPSVLGIRPVDVGDWDAYTHYWGVIGHLIGLEDRYNICRKNAEETRQVCQYILDRVYTPCMTNAPEYFEHMARVMIDGMSSINPTADMDSTIYVTKYLCNVPGYIYTEEERIAFQDKLRRLLKGKPVDTGVPASALIEEPVIEMTPTKPEKLHYVSDYALLSEIPYYKEISGYSKFKLNLIMSIFGLCSTYLGRLYFNLQYCYSLLLIKYLPYLAFLRYGIKASYTNKFVESPTDNTKPLTNDYYRNEGMKPMTWYQQMVPFLRK